VRAALVAVAVPLAVVTNAFRLSIILFVGSHVSHGAAKWVHDRETPFLVMLCTLLLLGIRALLLSLAPPSPPTGETPPPSQPVIRPRVQFPLGRALVAMAALVVAMAVRPLFASTAQQGRTGQDFLRDLTFPAGERQVTEQGLTPIEQATLRPDSALVRQYQRPGEPPIQLVVIAGRGPECVHSPRSCLAGGGWERMSERVHGVEVPDGTVATNRALLFQGRDQLLVTYFFTDGRYSTPHLAAFQAHSLFQRLRLRAPMHALIRVAVPVTGNAREAERLTDEFARSAFPAVLQRLREAH
jgi:EpsI family protein